MRLKADFLRWILGVPVDPARRSLLVDFVETYMPPAKREQTEFEHIVAADREYEEVEQVITVYEKRGIEKGRQEGRQEGRQAGLQAGLRKALILQLEKRFGKLDDAVKRRVRRIQSPDRLDACCWPCSGLSSSRHRFPITAEKAVCTLGGAPGAQPLPHRRRVCYTMGFQPVLPGARPWTGPD